jgi:hypothetical protein
MSWASAARCLTLIFRCLVLGSFMIDPSWDVWVCGCADVLGGVGGALGYSGKAIHGDRISIAGWGVNAGHDFSVSMLIQIPATLL